MASKLTPEREQEIRDWLALQDSLYAEGGVWHGRKQEEHHIRLAAAVAEIDRLRAEMRIAETHLRYSHIDKASRKEVADMLYAALEDKSHD